jgi:general L-amino acid transport system substrate-binding protein
VALGAVSAQATTLDDVKAKGFVQCGTNTGLLGFAAPDDAGNWAGFDVDFCRAVAAAIFNDPEAVKFTPLTAAERFTALQSGEVDLLARNTTWTMTRDASLGLSFVGVTYYDGQGFMVPTSLGVTSALELAGASVCVQTGTTTELNLADYFGANRMTYQLVAPATADETLKAYESARCAALTSDISQLHAERLKLARPGDHLILPDIISKEPLGPAVRQGDDQWFNIVKWTHFAMVNAEELGVSQKTIDQAIRSEKPDIKRLVGTEGDFGAQIGLEKDWAGRIVRLVGNYDEVFERNVGTGSRLGIPRGINNLWTNGGIHYAPPIR